MRKLQRVAQGDAQDNAQKDAHAQDDTQNDTQTRLIDNVSKVFVILRHFSNN